MSEQERRANKRVTVYRAQIPGSKKVWEAEYDAVADALHFACRDLREGRRIRLSITEEGSLIYDGEIIKRVCRKEDARLGESAAEGDAE
jgi:hypothetical protein